MFIRCFKYNRALLPDNFFAARKICRRAALRDHGGMVSNLENIDTIWTLNYQSRTQDLQDYEKNCF